MYRTWRVVKACMASKTGCGCWFWSKLEAWRRKAMAMQSPPVRDEKRSIRSVMRGMLVSPREAGERIRMRRVLLEAEFGERVGKRNSRSWVVRLVSKHKVDELDSIDEMGRVRYTLKVKVFCRCQSSNHARKICPLPQSGAEHCH